MTPSQLSSIRLMLKEHLKYLEGAKADRLKLARLVELIETVEAELLEQ